MIKKENLGNLSAASLAESYKCSECLHHKKHAHPQFQTVCTERGIKGIAVAPKCFTPDVSIIASNSDQFVQLATLISEYTPRQRRILIALMKQKPISKRRFTRQLAFGTKVFFLAMGKDYMSNYLSGYVMGLTSTGELIITGSPDQNSRGKSYMAYMTDDDNLMTPTEWKKKKEELRARNRVYDPGMRELPKRQDVEDAPTIDNAPKEWYSKQEKLAKKRRKGIKDLTELVAFDVSGA
jgi:hypothetical protein